MISIIMPTYNSERYILEAIISIVNQSVEDWELLCIDGGSQDRTIEIIEAQGDSRIRFIELPGSNMYEAINWGLKESRGEIIGFLNSDDLYFNKDIFEYQLNALTDVVCFSYGDLLTFSNTSVNYRKTWKVSKLQHDIFGSGSLVPHPTLFITRGLYEAVGDYRTDLKYSSDYDFTKKCFRASGIYIPRLITKMRRHSESHTCSGRLSTEKKPLNDGVIRSAYRQFLRLRFRLFSLVYTLYYRFKFG